MKHYYYNPIGGDLIILDAERQDIQIVERITKVKVWVKGEVRLGDFDESNGGETPEDQIARTGTYKNTTSKKGPRKCKACGKPGHRSDTCPDRQIA